MSQSGTPHKDASSSFLHSVMTGGSGGGATAAAGPCRSAAAAAAKQHIEVEVRMASVCYVHSAAFLEELKSCATDFKV